MTPEVIAMSNLDDLLAKESPEMVERINQKADEIVTEIRLNEIRQWLDKTQCDIAEAMGVAQPTVAKMEKAGNNVRLSTLKRYAESVGARISLDIELPDGTHRGINL